MRTKWLVGSASVVLAAAGLYSWGCSEVRCEDTETCEGAFAQTEGGPPNAVPAPDDGGGPAPFVDAAPPDCDASKDPREQPACLTESFAVFVDSDNGSDGGDGGTAGSRAAPAKTLSHALTLVDPARGRARIYVCGTTALGDNVDVGPAQNGISIHGGFACDGKGGWTAPPGQRSKLIALGGAPALHVHGVTQPILVSDFDIEAPIQAAAGASSIGVWAEAIATTAALTLRRVSVSAKDGVNGANGGDPAAWPQRAPGGANAADAANAGPAVANPACNTSIGGAGGANANGAAGAIAVAAGQELPLGATGGGGSGGLTDGGMCTPGFPGSAGRGGSAGAGATTWGSTSAETPWAPASGMVGGLATQGQGGGGGGGADATGAGGSGGAGGCRGAGGAAGLGGGASIAILAIQAKVVLESATLAAGAPGGGGMGGAGQLGQLAAATASSGAGATGCGGGLGGHGGSGGGGGGGAGGLAAGLVFRGFAPVVNGTTVTDTIDSDPAVTLAVAAGELDNGGAGGAGGAMPAGGAAASAGAAGGPGLKGASRAVLRLP